MPEFKRLATRNSSAYVGRLKKFHVSKVWTDTVERVLPQVTPNARVLDFGTGTGKILQLIAETEPTAALYGAEDSPILRNVAASKSRATILNFEQAGHLSEISLVLCLWVLGQTLDPWSTLQWIRHRLKAKGRLVLLKPNPLYSLVACKRREYKSDFPVVVPRLNSYHITSLLQECGYKLVSRQPVGRSFLGVNEACLFVAEENRLKE